MSGPVTRTVELDVTLDAPLSVGRVEVRRIVMAPGVAAGAHVHNGPVFGAILRGSVVYQPAGEPEVVLRAGDVFHEPGGERIERFDAREDGVEFVGVFPVGPGQDVILSPAP